MSFLQIVLLAVSLSMDACAVAVGAGASGRAVGRGARFRISFHFGLFQFLMPIVGWVSANAVAPLVSEVDHWIAFGLLWIVGLHMCWEGRTVGELPSKNPIDPSRGSSLIALSIATSIDALAVGVSLAFLGERILWPSVIIGVVTGSMSLGGMLLGTRLGSRFGRRMEIVGGVILLGIGLNILLAHLVPKV